MRLIIHQTPAALPPGSATSVADQSALAPTTLDGAEVLSTAPATPNLVGTDYETGVPVVASYLAITRYAGSPRQFYLFGVSADHEVIFDFDFDSAEDAEVSALESEFVIRAFKSHSG